MAYPQDVLGFWQQIRDKANTGSASLAAYGQSNYEVLKSLRDLLNTGNASMASYPATTLGLLQSIRDLLNTGHASIAAYSADILGVTTNIRDLLNTGSASVASYPAGYFGVLQAARDFGVANGVGTPVVTNTSFSVASASNATLSNNNLTVTRTNTSTGGANSTAYKTTGKFYFEVTVGASNANTDFIGTMQSGVSFGTVTGGSPGNYAGYWVKNNSILFSGGGQGGLQATPTAGQIISIAIDVGASLCWYRLQNGNWNNDASANPATGTNGKACVSNVAPVVAFSSIGSPQAGDNFTANFGSSAFSFSVPSGFTSGWTT